MTANAIDLTTLAAVNSYMNDVNTAQDAATQVMITALSQEILRLTGLTYPAATFTEHRMLKCAKQAIMLRRFPVTSVTSVVPTGSTTTLPQSVSGTRGWRVNDDSDCLEYVYGYFPPCDLTITYTAGYASPPPDLSTACIRLVATWYRELNRLDEKGISAGQQTISLEMGIPVRCREMINALARKYRPA